MFTCLNASKILGALLILGALSGCATFGGRYAVDAQPDAVSIQNVPFYPNTSDQCGPAVLASVLNYWGKNVTPEELKSEVYVPRLGGTLPMDILPALRSRGLSAQAVYGNFDFIKEELHQGRPVIAYLDFGTKRRPIGHLVVVTGFNDRKKTLTIHSREPNKKASYQRFDRGWSDTGRWMVVAMPQLSTAAVSSVPLGPIQEELSALDRVRLGQIYEDLDLDEEATKQYERALQMDKTYVPALIARGNQAFHQGEYKIAEKYFKRALKSEPDHGGANNNLAMTYLMQNKHLQKAEELAKTAATSPDFKVYAADTLQQIAQRKKDKL